MSVSGKKTLCAALQAGRPTGVNSTPETLTLHLLCLKSKQPIPDETEEVVMGNEERGRVYLARGQRARKPKGSSALLSR